MSRQQQRRVCILFCVSTYHLPRICHTLVPGIRIHTEMLHVIRYIDVLTHMHGVKLYLIAWTTGATRAFREDYRRRQVGECTDTWYIRGFSLLRQWTCSCLATCQRTCVNQKQPMG